ncbi:glycine cleavage system H protein-like [Branchiostoma floridae x Branchiostoma belcheri]
MAVSAVRKFTKEHEWITVDGTTGTIGITYHAQDKLGEMVFVEFPEVGEELSKGDACGCVESVKEVRDLYAPVSGQCVEVNLALQEEPTLVNSSPYDDGWIIKMKLSKPEELDDMMDEEAYRAYLKANSMDA